jgi:YD repeat-containing protein
MRTARARLNYPQKAEVLARFTELAALDIEWIPYDLLRALASAENPSGVTLRVPYDAASKIACVTKDTA